MSTRLDRPDADLAKSESRRVLKWPLALALLAVIAGALIVVLWNGGESSRFPILRPERVERATQLEDVIHAYEAAWAAHDLDAFASFLADDEFLFTDPGNTAETKQEFVEIMDEFVLDPEHVGAGDNRFFVGGDEVVEAYTTWGFGGATEDNPVEEVDLFTIRADDKITSVQSMYGSHFWWLTGVDPTELVEAYATAWSSLDPSVVENLYAENAIRSESLYEVEVSGREEIGRYAAEFFERHPGFSTAVVHPYVFSGEGVSGAVFALSDENACSIDYVVLLETDDAGAVTSERVYYDIDAIGGCDWQR